MAKSKQSDNLKRVLKSAIVELIEENEELVRRVLEEAVEDAFMTRAIKKGRRTKRVSRERVFRILAASPR